MNFCQQEKQKISIFNYFKTCRIIIIIKSITLMPISQFIATFNDVIEFFDTFEKNANSAFLLLP